MPDEDYLKKHTVGEIKPRAMPVEVVDYNPEWPHRFGTQAALIRNALGEKALHIEHAGSTSAPGLATKPVIDVVLEVADSSAEDEYVPALESAGYRLRIREPEWFEHRLLKGVGGDVNLHVFSKGCAEIERMIRFRDWLRSHPEDRELYARTKRELARREWEHTQNYADAKSAVVAEIWSRIAGV
jgi:GrpB-like predicted nucleotidyltransferase (UPF0157 family)